MAEQKLSAEEDSGPEPVVAAAVPESDSESAVAGKKSNGSNGSKRSDEEKILDSAVSIFLTWDAAATVVPGENRHISFCAPGPDFGKVRFCHPSRYP